MLVYRVAYVTCFVLFLSSAFGWNLFDFQQKGKPQEGALRLVGGGQSTEGRVEVYHDGQWGTVCDDDWDQAEAQVVCRQLGFPGAVMAKPGASYEQGSGQIWLDDMNCKGSESFLFKCQFKGWGITDCSHKEDAGVVCKSVVEDRQPVSLDHSLGLSEELGTLFDSGNGCDVTVTVRDPSAEQAEEKTICVHRLILLLYPNFNITTSSESLSVEISQTCHPHVSSFFRYLYTHKIDVSVSSAQCLHQLAYMFQLKQLLKDVGKVFTMLLPQDTTFHTQVALYDHGVRTKDMLLQENVLQYLSWNFEFLVVVPVWKTLSVQMMEALLSRSDLVVRDEAFVLQSLEDWIIERGDAVSAEQRLDLLSLIRFPMITAEKLFEIQFNSKLYQNNKVFYGGALLKAFQFNSLSFSKIRKHFSNFEDYLPRVYTTAPWGTVINSTSNHQSYHYNSYSPQNQISFNTPIHNSVMYEQQTTQWIAQVLLQSWECSNQGFNCESFPTARLTNYNTQNYQDTVRFNNRLILTCKSKNIVFNVQEFKSNLAAIQSNSTISMLHPCADDYSYTFVVRPEYVALILVDSSEF